uniref:Uncharacterized protein n=1 Tax=uncultured bacterium contig00093 TaxID=1181564 RepID=A0A806KEY6_9BACT|nr:hypothetical protein [uncultured bacterium contig00093]
MMKFQSQYQYNSSRQATPNQNRAGINYCFKMITFSRGEYCLGEWPAGAQIAAPP